MMSERKGRVSACIYKRLKTYFIWFCVWICFCGLLPFFLLIVFFRFLFVDFFVALFYGAYTVAVLFGDVTLGDEIWTIENWATMCKRKIGRRIRKLDEDLENWAKVHKVENWAKKQNLKNLKQWI